MGNQDLLIKAGFYIDTSYRGHNHIRYIHPKRDIFFFNERGTDKIRYTLAYYCNGTLKFSEAWHQDRFEKFMKEIFYVD